MKDILAQITKHDTAFLQSIFIFEVRFQLNFNQISPFTFCLSSFLVDKSLLSFKFMADRKQLEVELGA